MEVILVAVESPSYFFDALNAEEIRRHVFNKKITVQLPVQKREVYKQTDLRAAHLIAVEDDGAVVGAWLMVPASRDDVPHGIPEEFLDETAMLSIERVWELSQFSINNDYYGDDTQSLNKLIASLTCAALEFSILNGIAELRSVEAKAVTNLATKYLGEAAWEMQSAGPEDCDVMRLSYEPSMGRLYALRAQFNLPSPIMTQYQVTSANLVAWEAIQVK